MSDIKIIGYEGDYYANQISCGKLNTFGRSIKRMYWIDVPADPENPEEYPAAYGWYNADGTEDYNNDSLTPGEGLWFDIGEEWAKVQSSGKIVDEALPVPLSNGNQLVANATPNNLTMGQVWIEGYGDEYYANQISCGILNTFGRSIKRMYWIDVPADPENPEEYPAAYGWYNADGTEDYNNDPLNAGESLWVDNGVEGVTMNFPSPFKKD